MSKSSRSIQRAVRLIAFVSPALVACPAVRDAAGEQDRVPEGLSASEWSNILAAYEANRHAVFAVEGSAGVSPAYQARNPGQQWRTRFNGYGFMTCPDSAGGRGSSTSGTSRSPSGTSTINAAWSTATRCISGRIRPPSGRGNQEKRFQWLKPLATIVRPPCEKPTAGRQRE